MPALSSRRSSSAWSRRGHGQTPICSIEGASIAITTTSPVAARDCQAKRKSVRTLRSVLGQLVSSAIASIAATSMCGR